MLVTSSATGQGLDELRRELLRARAGAEPPAARRAGEDERSPSTGLPPGRRARLQRRARRRRRASGSRGARVERLIARHDLDNEEALAHVERRLHRMGVVARWRPQGFQPGDDVEIAGVVFELDPPVGSGAMARVVVKLGSSIVADDARRAARATCSSASATRSPRARAGDDVVVVSSGAIARGMEVMGLAARPRAIEDLQAASAVGPGQALPRLRRAAARARRHQRAGAADVLRHERAHATTSTRARRCAGCSTGASCRSSTRTTRRRPTRSPSATTTSSPRRWRSSSAPTLLVLLTDIDGLYTADPRADPGARARRRGRPTSRRSTALDDRPRRRRRSARAGCARRSSPPRWRPPPASPR